jgi:hypothetical protein
MAWLHLVSATGPQAQAMTAHAGLHRQRDRLGSTPFHRPHPPAPREPSIGGSVRVHKTNDMGRLEIVNSFLNENTKELERKYLKGASY